MTASALGTMGLPLDGIKVLSFEIQVAGPYCSMMLADRGADVVKVERPGTGDTARHGAPIVTNDDGDSRSGYFLRFNRNKRSITLDIKTAEGQDVFRRLAARSDVVIENFRPGVLASLGLGYADLKGDNPGLIFASITGFGSTEGFEGPYSGRPAYDIVAQAMSGLMNTCGQAGGPPTWLGVALGDIVSGMNAAHAITLALYHRQQTGIGQYVDVAMLDSMVALAERSVTAYSLTGRVLERGNEPFMAPWGPFECRDGWIALIVATERDWQRFCNAISRTDLVGATGTESGTERASNMDGWLGDLIRTWFHERSKAEALAALDQAGLPAGPVHTAHDVFDSPHVAARQLMLDIDDPVMGTVRVVGSPVKMSGAAANRSEPPPALGEHTGEVLAEIGLGASEVRALVERGIV